MMGGRQHRVVFSLSRVWSADYRTATAALAIGPETGRHFFREIIAYDPLPRAASTCEAPQVLCVISAARSPA